MNKEEKENENEKEKEKEISHIADGAAACYILALFFIGLGVESIWGTAVAGILIGSILFLTAIFIPLTYCLGNKRKK